MCNFPKCSGKPKQTPMQHSKHTYGGRGGGQLVRYSRPPSLALPFPSVTHCQQCFLQVFAKITQAFAKITQVFAKITIFL